MSSNLNHGRRRPIILSSPSVGPSTDEFNTHLDLPDSDPPDMSSDDIPLSVLKREVERQSPGSDTDYATPLRRLFRQRSPTPPLETAIPIPSSDDTVMFTPRTERKIRVNAGQIKRMESLARNRAQAEESRIKERDEWLEKEAETDQKEKEEDERRRTEFFDTLLEDLHNHKYSMAEFLDYVFNPELQHNHDWQWRGFFKKRAIVERIFGYWTTSGYNRTTHAIIKTWVMREMSQTVGAESTLITDSGILRKTNKVINERFFLDYSIVALTKRLRELAPSIFAICDAFSTTARQARSMTEKWLHKKEIVRALCQLAIHTRLCTCR